MKNLLMMILTITGLTMCHYAPATTMPEASQTTQIITPDGRLITCIQNGQLITCF